MKTTIGGKFMGSWGWLIAQNDMIADIADDLRYHSCTYEDVVLYKGWEPSSSLFKVIDGQTSVCFSTLGCIIYATALALSSVRKYLVKVDYYGAPHETAVKVLKMVPLGSVSAEALAQAKDGLQVILKAIELEKDYLVSESMNQESFYEAIGASQKPPFSNLYEFYKAVADNLVHGFEEVGITGSDPVSNGRLLRWHTYHYYAEMTDLDEGVTELVPSMDDKMLSVGLPDVLLLDSGDRATCCYAAKLREYFDGPTTRLLKSLYETHKLHCYHQSETTPCINFFEGIETLPEDNEVDCVITITDSPNNSDVVVVDCFNGFIPIHDVKVPRWEFEACTGKFSRLFKVAWRYLNKYIELGISIDKLTFYISGHVFTDINKASNFVCAEGISRVFDSVWWVPDNPIPLTEDTYEAIVFFGIPKDNPVDVCCLRAYALNMLQSVSDKKDCGLNNLFIQAVAHVYNVRSREGNGAVGDALANVCRALAVELADSLTPKKGEKGYGSGASTACISDANLYKYYDSLVV